MAKPATLLEKAQSIKQSRRLSKKPSRERLDLDLAFLRGDINYAQYTSALNCHITQAYQKLAASMRQAVAAEMITITINQ